MESGMDSPWALPVIALRQRAVIFKEAMKRFHTTVLCTPLYLILMYIEESAFRESGGERGCSQ